MPETVPGISDIDLYKALRESPDPVTVVDSEGIQRSFELARDGSTNVRPLFVSAPATVATPPPAITEEIQKAIQRNASTFKEIEENHPLIAQSLINNPHLMPMLPELAAMLSGTSYLDDVTIDVTASLMAAIPGIPEAKEYAASVFETPVQHLFWQDVASKILQSDDRELLTHLFAKLSERGADRVASLAFAWLSRTDLQGEELRKELVPRLWNWVEREQEEDRADQGVGGFLDRPQEAVERFVDSIISAPISWFGSPDEAIKRSGLTHGQQFAYQVGLDPDSEAWRWVSGSVDFLGEIVLDPLNLIAGAGLGFWAANRIPAAPRMMRAGRLAFARKSAVPFRGRKISPLQTRSLTARAVFAMRAKPADQIIDLMRTKIVRGGKTMADDMFDLLRRGDRATFHNTYKGLNIPEELLNSAHLFDNSGQFMDVLKYADFSDNLLPGNYNQLRRAERAARKALDDAKKVGKPTRDLEIDLLKRQIDVKKARDVPDVFIMTELPRKTRVFKPGLLPRPIRRLVNDLVQNVPDEIRMDKTRQGAQDLRKFLNHYAVDENIVGELVNKFIDLDFGFRKSFIMEEVMPVVAEATKNPLLRWQLIEYYQNANHRAFGLGDEAADGSRIAMFDSQLTNSFPLHIAEMDAIIRRTRQARTLRALGQGNRSIIRGFSLLGRKSPAAARRKKLVDLFRTKLDGAPGLTDEDLYGMAYSWIGSPFGDPRGWFHRMTAGVGGAIHGRLHTAFTAGMLALAPIRWMWRVVILEEQLRAQIWGMPNMYGNPIGWFAGLFNDYSLNRAHKWGADSRKWANGVREGILGDAKTVEAAMKAVRDSISSADEIFEGRRLNSVNDVRRALGDYLHSSIADRNVVRGLPGGNSLRVQLRTRALAHDAKLRARHKLTDDFRPKDDLPDIKNKFITAFLADDIAKAASGTVPYSWSRKMSQAGRKTYGLVWGEKVGQIASDSSLRFALKRKAARAAGKPIPKGARAEDYLQSGSWRRMGNNIRRFYPDEVGVQVSDDFINTGSELFHGTVRTFDEFDSGLSGFRGKTTFGQRESQGRKFYFSEDQEVASRFASQGIPESSLSDLVRHMDPEDVEPVDLEHIFDDLTDVFVKIDEDVSLVRSADELLRKVDEGGFSFDEVTILQLRPDKHPRVIRTTVYGKTLDLTDDLGVLPDDLLEALHKDGLVRTTGFTGKRGNRLELESWHQHENRFSNTAEWMRDNGYGKARVPDALESGGESIIGLEEFIGDIDTVLSKIQPHPDLARIERYLDEKLGGYIDELLDPFFKMGTPPAKVYDDVLHRRVEFNFNGTDHSIDLRKSGQSKRELQDLVVAADEAITFPSELVAPNVDWRFLDGGDRRLWRRVIDWNLHTFGEKASQFLVRRPFWLNQRARWLKHYTDLNVPIDLAVKMAESKATHLTNYVMYDLSEAPHMIKRLNNIIPFFGAFYEVTGTWAYKMPAAIGGWWVSGVPEFGRKIDRIMSALINAGVVEVREGLDGQPEYVSRLQRDPDTGSALGDALGKLGYYMLRTPRVALAHIAELATKILPMREKYASDLLALDEAEYEMAVGDPLNPFDFGTLSFAGGSIGLGPTQNLAAWGIGKFFPGSDYQQIVAEDESLADLSDQMEVDVEAIVQLNKGLVIEQYDNTVYRGLLMGTVDPADITLTGIVLKPDSSLIRTLIDNVFFPFGLEETAGGHLWDFTPAMIQHTLRGIGLLSLPLDGDWMEEGPDGIGGFFPLQSRVTMNGQLLEAAQYLESTEQVFSEKILPLQKQIRDLDAAGRPESDPVVQQLQDELHDEWERIIPRILDIAGGNTILRGLGSQFFPAAPRSVRREQDVLNTYFQSRDFAEQLAAMRGQPGKVDIGDLGRVSSIEDIEEFNELVGLSLFDPTGDGARAWMRENYPQLMAYLQPKTFWTGGGIPPEMTGWDDHLENLLSERRQGYPMGVFMIRALLANNDADYWIDHVVTNGSDPVLAAATALNDPAYHRRRQQYFDTRDAIFMTSDLHGAEYFEWIEEKNQDEYSIVENNISRQRELQDKLGELQDLELDPYLSEAEIERLHKTARTLMAQVSDIIEQMSDEEDDDFLRNPYDLAINTWWKDVYGAWDKKHGELWDQVNTARDEGEKQLLFEQIRSHNNEWTYRNETLFGRTDVPFPSPLTVKWARMDDEARIAYVMRRATQPLEWQSLDDIRRMAQFEPSIVNYFPSTQAEMEIYERRTEAEVLVDSQWRRGEITSTQRRAAKDSIEEQFMARMIAQGRTNELAYMELWPIERLHILGLLDPRLEYLIPQVRFIRQDLQARGGVGPDTIPGREHLIPIYQSLIERGTNDPEFGDLLDRLALQIYEQTEWNDFLPKFIAGDWGNN